MFAETEQIYQDFDFNHLTSGGVDTVDNECKSLSDSTDTTPTDNVNRIDLLPEAVKRRVYALKKLNEQKKTIEFQFVEEFLQLIKKYEQMYEPFHEKRAQIVSGKCDQLEDYLLDDYNSQVIHQTQVAGIPDFWLKVLCASKDFSKRIFAEDLPVLRHLMDIRVITEPQERKFSLEFYFSPNEYFTNDVICKDFYLKIDLQQTDLCRPLKVVSTDIEWKDGKCIPYDKVIDQNTGQEVYNYYDSFFDYFWTSNEDIEDYECLEYDWNVSRDLIQELVPNAVNYFTGHLFIGEHCEKCIAVVNEHNEELVENQYNYEDNQSDDNGYYGEEDINQEVVEDEERDEEEEEEKDVNEDQDSQEIHSQSYE